MVVPLSLKRSGCSFGMGLVGLSLAIRSATTAFWDPGVVQAVYCVFIPMIVFACSMLAGFWVETLPSQVRLQSEGGTGGEGVEGNGRGRGGLKGGEAGGSRIVSAE